MVLTTFLKAGLKGLDMAQQYQRLVALRAIHYKRAVLTRLPFRMCAYLLPLYYKRGVFDQIHYSYFVLHLEYVFRHHPLI